MFKGGYQLIDFTKYVIDYGDDTVTELSEEDAKYYLNIVKNVKNKFLLGKVKVEVNSSMLNDIIYIPFISYADSANGYFLIGNLALHFVNNETGSTDGIASSEIYLNLQEKDGVVTGKLISTVALLQLGDAS